VLRDTAQYLWKFKGWLNKIRETRRGFFVTDLLSPRSPRWVFWLVRPHKVSEFQNVFIVCLNNGITKHPISPLCCVTWLNIFQFQNMFIVCLKASGLMATTA